MSNFLTRWADLASNTKSDDPLVATTTTSPTERIWSGLLRHLSRKMEPYRMGNIQWCNCNCKKLCHGCFTVFQANLGSWLNHKKVHVGDKLFLSTSHSETSLIALVFIMLWCQHALRVCKLQHERETDTESFRFHLQFLTSKSGHFRFWNNAIQSLNCYF